MFAQRPALLGLFPWIGTESHGGVQLSGRLAWAGLHDALSPAQTRLLCYAPGQQPPNVHALAATVATSKLGALRAALASPRPHRALIWHVGMLRLLPWLRVPPGRAALFLHGVEVWRRHDPLTRALLNRVGLFLSNSAYTWNRFVEHYPALAQRPHQVVHLGLGEPIAAPPPPPAGPPAALIVARMERGEDYKGHRELIAAWPAVRAQLPAAELWVAGEGDLRPELERFAAEHGLGGAIRFFGAISEARKQELIAASRCLAMPSRGEGFGLVYLEAMRLGRPCLVSTHDAGREVVAPPEAGLAANPARPAALAAALIRLLAEGPEWQAWSERATARYQRMFTADHYRARLNAALGLTA